ncbi:DUF3307 domain-containing protein [Shimia sp. SDUM112013]|uniref:DUF3307 domain-containing protein n=1 Tax=Shimia sp. SDUM112013 TaxID=3136160 RepID=UPI0032ED7542
METTTAILLLFAALQIKHLLADFYFQTMWMMDGRDRYFHLGRTCHAGVHVAFSAVILLAFSTPLPLLVGIVVLEWVLHFHIDWWKAGQNKSKGWTPADAAFWRALGVDQTLHHLCYILMVWIWLTYA